MSTLVSTRQAHRCNSLSGPIINTSYATLAWHMRKWTGNCSVGYNNHIIVKSTKYTISTLCWKTEIYCRETVLIHTCVIQVWLNKMDDIWQTTLSNVMLKHIFSLLIRVLLKSVWYKRQYSCNGFIPKWRQSITRINDDPVQRRIYVYLGLSVLSNWLVFTCRHRHIFICLPTGIYTFSNMYIYCLPRD